MMTGFRPRNQCEAYLRFSLLGGVIAQQIRNLGFTARVHSVMDSEVVQPPLMLLSGLGEVSRIGEVILNPFLGPRLKAGTVTTSMKLAHDRPIDFGLQKFCEACNKCARECPSGAITAGPKLMFNGYEIWKSDSQKCATYRITTEGGAMCGRCMKTCPWNLEGLFAEAPFRWAASKLPVAAKYLAKLDDLVGNGKINPVKKWWWDLEMQNEGPYEPARKPANSRNLQTSLKVSFEEQTLAVYPANLVPPPYPWPFPMDREAAIAAHDSLISAEETSPATHRWSAAGACPVAKGGRYAGHASSGRAGRADDSRHHQVRVFGPKWQTPSRSHCGSSHRRTDHTGVLSPVLLERKSPGIADGMRSPYCARTTVAEDPS